MKRRKPSQWETKLLKKLKPLHPRGYKRYAKRISQRISATTYALKKRSKKHGVECKTTAKDLQKLVYNGYGTPCKYCGRTLTIKNFVVDHIVPISKGGSSNIDNLQLICKTSNGMKGSLSEEHFMMLVNWLNTVPEELKKDVSIRLARGIH